VGGAGTGGWGVSLANKKKQKNHTPPFSSVLHPSPPPLSCPTNFFASSLSPPPPPPSSHTPGGALTPHQLRSPQTHHNPWWCVFARRGWGRETEQLRLLRFTPSWADRRPASLALARWARSWGLDSAVVSPYPRAWRTSPATRHPPTLPVNAAHHRARQPGNRPHRVAAQHVQSSRDRKTSQTKSAIQSLAKRSGARQEGRGSSSSRFGLRQNPPPASAGAGEPRSRPPNGNAQCQVAASGLQMNP